MTLDIGSFQYFGQAILDENKNKWKINYVQNKELLQNKNNRIYLIIVDDEIKKIGSSSAQGGIKDTFRHYVNPGKCASKRTLGIHSNIKAELEKGRKVKLYCKFNTHRKEIIKGFFSEQEIEVCSNIFHLEKLHLKDFKNIHNCYPVWNLKEKNEKWD